MDTKERFYFTAKGLPKVKFHVVRFTGTERMNGGFSFKIHLVIKELSFDPTALIFQPCIFSIHREKETDVVYSGHAKEIFYEKAVRGLSFINIEFIPHIFLLEASSQSKIYLDKSLPDLIKDIMSSSRYMLLPYEIRFSRKYPVQEFSMQYNETPMNYLRYKLEEQGAYFFIDDAGGKVIFADNPQSHAKSIGNFRYAPESGLEPDSKEEILTTLSASLNIIPGKAVVRNYDWKNPNKILVGMKDTIKQASVLTSAVFSDEDVPSQDEADRIACIRAEEMLCRRLIAKGTSYAPHLHPGVVLTVIDHPNNQFNIDFMITEINHEGSQESFIAQMLGFPASKEAEKRSLYSNSFTCVRADLPFHPERKTQRSFISGMVNAFIDGDDPKVPILDSYGRYKVLFPFDLSGRSGGKASCWVRRLQEQVGKDCGMTFPLLPGTEVTISFINGNPDRPIIAGALSNGETGSLSGPGNKNFSGIRTSGGAQLTFDNNHHGISLIGSGGSGINLGSGSASYLTTDTHTGLNIAASTCSDVAGYCQSNLTGFQNTTSAMCGQAMKYVFGIVGLLTGQASKILNTLASSSNDADSANTMSNVGTAMKQVSSLCGPIMQIIMAATIPSAAYNQQLSTQKNTSTHIIQCFPSTAELVVNIVIMLIGSIGSIAATGVDAANANNAADTADKGNVGKYQEVLLEAMRAVYDRRSYVEKPYLEFNYTERTETSNDEEGNSITKTIPVGEYYTGAQSTPCSYYDETTVELANIISAVNLQIQNIEDNILNLQIKVTSSAMSEENRINYIEQLNLELSQAQKKQTELKYLQALSADLDAQYKNSCIGEQTKEDYYNYEKQKTTRNAVTNSINAILPEIATTVSMAVWMHNLKNKNIGGIFINAMDKNINLHAATYIGQHAGRGIYLNTLKAAIINGKKNECGDWGSPLYKPEQQDSADKRISDIFTEIKDEELDVGQSVTQFLNDGHKNVRKDGEKGKWGDGINMPYEETPKTSFIAARTNLSYTKATYEIHYLDDQYRIVTPYYQLVTTLDNTKKQKTNFELGDFSVLLSSPAIELNSSKDNTMNYYLVLSEEYCCLGVPRADGDKAFHGISITKDALSIAQNTTEKAPALVLKDKKATLSAGEGGELLLHLNGSKKLAEFSADEVYAGGMLMSGGKVEKTKNGMFVVGKNNDIKVTGLDNAENSESGINDDLENQVNTMNEADNAEEQQEGQSDNQSGGSANADQEDDNNIINEI